MNTHNASLPIRRQFPTGSADSNDLELDEAALIGRSALVGTKTSVYGGLVPCGGGPVSLPNDGGIVKTVLVEQDSRGI